MNLILYQSIILHTSVHRSSFQSKYSSSYLIILNYFIYCNKNTNKILEPKTNYDSFNICNFDKLSLIFIK